LRGKFGFARRCSETVSVDFKALFTGLGEYL